MRKTRRNNRQRRTRKRVIGGAKAERVNMTLYGPTTPFSNLAHFRQFFQKNPDISAKTTINGASDTILRNAIYANDPDIVKFLLDRFDLTEEEGVNSNINFLNDELRYAIIKYNAKKGVDLRNNETEITKRKQIISLLIEKGARSEYRPNIYSDNRFVAHAFRKQQEPAEVDNTMFDFETARQSIVDRKNTSQLIDRVDAGLHNKGLGRENPFNSDIVVSRVFDFLNPTAGEYRNNRSITRENMGMLAEDKAARDIKRYRRTDSPQAEPV